ncbi:MAG: ABC transporter ATP-binding protein [Oscillospiraceae bacterium]|nr:ABC transporter ATP-binding protein [Oscillospiraceae bacterium]
MKNLWNPARNIGKSAIPRWEVLLLTENKKNTKSILLRLGGYVFKEWPLFLSAVIFTLLSNQLSLLGPKYSGAAIDAIEFSAGSDLSAVWENVIKMAVCYIFSALLSYFLAVIMIHLSQKIVYAMRKQLFEKLNTLPVGYFDTHPTGDIISRISYDIDTINSSLSHDLVQVMTSIYTVIGSLVFMWNISRPMILIFAFTVPASILFTRYRSKKVRPLFSERSRKLGELNGFAEEMLSGTRTIEAYGKQGVISGRFNERNESAMEAYYRAEYYGATLGPSVNFINNLSMSLVAMLGGILYMLSFGGKVDEASVFFITLGGVAQFVQYSRKFAGPINEFANILHEFQSAFSAAERVFRIIDEEPEPEDSAEACGLDDVEGSVEFDDVSFGYTPEKTILHDIDFTAKPGKTIAIVGPTGAGKTTIINLLMRFYDADSGEIRLDSLPIKNIKRRDLRKAYTMVLQDTWLFHGTIFENIVYGRENATFEEVKAAAKAARIDSYIESLPDGYETVLSDDGTNISKGQRQLITIARAFLSDAPMLILDEATSNVDSRTEIKIQEAMAELMKGRTCFVIAHRLSTIQNADNILVVQHGTITEQGTHEELMQKGGFYSTLYNSQFA